MIKKPLRIVVGVAAILLSAIIAFYCFTSGPANVANDFFKAVKEQNISKAYAYLSEDFKAGADERALSDFLSRCSLAHFKESKWANRQTDNDRALLDGLLTTETGGAAPIRMTFVKEGDAWKICAIQKLTAPRKDGASRLAPTEAEQMALAKQSIHDFIISVGRKSMDHFRAGTSRHWRERQTTEQLNQTFKALIDSAENLAALDEIDPILVAESNVGDDGVLTLTGYYPTKPSEIHFEQQYIYEGIAWKLIGFKIEAQ